MPKLKRIQKHNQILKNINYETLNTLSIKATQSRLMGVIGIVYTSSLKINNKEYIFIQNYYLDCNETYIDSYQSYLYELIDFDINTLVNSPDLSINVILQQEKIISTKNISSKNSIEVDYFALIPSINSKSSTHHIKLNNQYITFNINSNTILNQKNFSHHLFNPFETKKFQPFSSPFVPLEKDEYFLLINHFAKGNKKQSLTLPGFTDEYRYILKKHQNYNIDELRIVTKKLCTPIYNTFELIHYFLMRTISNDTICRALLSSKTCPFELTEENPNAFLLENTIISSTQNSINLNHCNIKDGVYNSKAIIDYPFLLEEYSFEFIIKNQKIHTWKMLNQKTLPSSEIYGTLNNLYLSELQIKSNTKQQLEINALLSFLQFIFPSAITNKVNEKTTLMLFNPNNNHVNEKKYILANDLYAEIIIDKNTNLIVASSKKENLIHIIETIKYNFTNILSLFTNENDNFNLSKLKLTTINNLVNITQNQIALFLESKYIRFSEFCFQNSIKNN